MTTTERLNFQNDGDGDLQFQNDTPLNVYFTVEGEEPIAPDYDVQAAVDTLFPGLVIQRPLRDAAEAFYLSVGRPLETGDIHDILVAANELNAAQVVAGYVPSIMPDYPTSLPAYPTGLPRFPDTDGGMQSPDGWCITTDGKVVNI